MKDYILTATAYNNEVRIYTARTTNLVEESRKIHGTYKTATAALGRLLTAASMMSLMTDELRISLKIESDGPISPISVIAKEGLVKGYLGNPHVYFTHNNGKLDVKSAVGDGFLYVTRDINNNYYTSSSKLVSGEIAEDLTYYFAHSEQIPSSVGLGVLTEDKKAITAGGFIIQLMPFAKEETISTIESIITNIKPITTLLEEGYTPEKLLSLLANNTEKILLKKETKYHCGCSKENFKEGLLKLDKDILVEMLLEDKQIEIICEYCKKKYLFNEDELKELISLKQ
ncbi:MAG: Hsp33 family molecular chaperone HslO [Acholeplasmataceae bacterium]